MPKICFDKNGLVPAIVRYADTAKFFSVYDISKACLEKMTQEKKLHYYHRYNKEIRSLPTAVKELRVGDNGQVLLIEIEENDFVSNLSPSWYSFAASTDGKLAVKNEGVSSMISYDEKGLVSAIVVPDSGGILSLCDMSKDCLAKTTETGRLYSYDRYKEQITAANPVTKIDVKTDGALLYITVEETADDMPLTWGWHPCEEWKIGKD